MENKKDLRFIIIFIVIVGISLIYLAQASYAKYRRQIDGNVEATVAQWNIKVNNELINNKSVLTNDITPYFESNPYIKSGVLAPGGTGYFDLSIDGTEVDVDFTYQITIENDESAPLEDLIITRYEQDRVAYNYDSETGITGNITKNTGPVNVRVYFMWNDSETNVMDNQADTEYATQTENPIAYIIAKVRFKQKQ